MHLPVRICANKTLVTSQERAAPCKHPHASNPLNNWLTCSRHVKARAASVPAWAGSEAEGCQVVLLRFPEAPLLAQHVRKVDDQGLP